MCDLGDGHLAVPEARDSVVADGDEAGRGRVAFKPNNPTQMFRVELLGAHHDWVLLLVVNDLLFGKPFGNVLAKFRPVHRQVSVCVHH